MKPWGFSWRLLVGFILVILVTVLSFSFLLMGRLENYLLHDMENCLSNQVLMARGSIEFALAQARVSSLSSLDPSTRKALEHLAVGLGSQTASRILFTDQNGKRVIYSAYWTKKDASFAGVEEIREAIVNGYGADTRSDSITHKYTMYVAYPVRALDGKIIGVMRVSKGVGSVRSLLSTIQNRMILAGLVAAAVAAMVSVGMAFTLARPLRRIQEAAVRFGRGDLEARSSLKGSGEMADLSRTFDRMADRIEHTVEELAQLDVMKSQFVANVSHDLKTPLTAIKGLSETLLDGAVEDERVNRKFVLDILSESERLLLMVNNILDVARIEAGVAESERGEFDLEEAVTNVVDRMAYVAERRGVEIETVIDSQLPIVAEDSSGIEQAIANVVDNAIKYSEAGSLVRITVEQNTVDGRQGIQLTIADSGPGISPDDLENIFDRFFTTTAGDRSSGTGLGLAIVKNKVESSGGTISIDSERGRGTCVSIWLPAEASE